jgi:hypothetical protein
VFSYKCIYGFMILRINSNYILKQYNTCTFSEAAVCFLWSRHIHEVWWSWETATHANSKRIPYFLQNNNIHHYVRKCSTPDSGPYIISIFIQDPFQCYSALYVDPDLQMYTKFKGVVSRENKIFIRFCICQDRLCGLVVRLPGCTPRDPGFNSQCCQIFWVAMGLEQGPLSPCEGKWGATWMKSSSSDLENWD